MMIELMKNLLRFAWRRNSESAVILAINLSRWINWRDCRDLGAYYMAVGDVKDPTPIVPLSYDPSVLASGKMPD